MAIAQSTKFYSDLHVYDGPLVDIYANSYNFCEVPDDWTIVVTDVEQSTIAVQNGKQQEVNLAATGSIVACLNIARDAGIDIPFFFGGDGATLLLPEQLKSHCLQALTYHQERCLTSFDFYLRVGFRSVKEMRQRGCALNISKFKRNSYHVMPLIQGDALQRAESEIKSSEAQELDITELETKLLNLEGMECKWDKISPPDDGNEVLALIINATDVNQQHDVYTAILKEMDRIYGDDTQRNPVTMERLKMVNSLSQLKNEVKIKYASSDLRKVISTAARSVFGSLYVKFTEKGRNYLNELIQLTEVLLLDGSINTVIAGTVEKRKELFKMLDNLERNDQIQYGFYSSSSSILSCYVTALDDYHIHFLDGDNGGYTRASKVLKRKISA
ncbi:Protein of unknown function [Nonlabens sp. Hel1_33_55]|uniref:DUF3095 family protein n=1 Tax=Nonlabens sp. Hel1_33_55 TaxID=1336802 RepID=UPI000875B388|nr:DUF3095 family protein [Nonlabens sp. Hel1_33_55]SCY09825.1 Protein of unknown function [Nonlabens sp. Hel1_33_55]